MILISNNIVKGVSNTLHYGATVSQNHLETELIREKFSIDYQFFQRSIYLSCEVVLKEEVYIMVGNVVGITLHIKIFWLHCYKNHPSLDQPSFLCEGMEGKMRGCIYMT